MKLCKKCGKPVEIITQRLYKKIIVDASPVLVMPDPLGEEFIRMDGTKMRGTTQHRWDDDRKICEGVFRPHYRTCGMALEDEDKKQLDEFFESMSEIRV